MTGDFNGDGTPDLACMYDTGGDTNSIKVLLGDGTGKYEGDWETWDTNIWYDCDNVTNRFVAGDFNGDGKDDIAALYDYTYYDATDSGQVQVFRSTGTDFASKEWWYYGGKRAYDASKTAGLVSADYNGDGKAEIHALYDMGSGQANVYEFRKKEDFALDRFALVTDAWNSYAVLVEDENAASGLLESVTNGTNAAIRYTYDGNGNITEIHEGTQLKARYAYDSLNQLIREDNAYTGKTVTYTYDAGGNILGKTEYTYTTGELGSPTRTVVYGYTDSTWKDLLTSYDGTAITYDTIGNPLNWRGGMSFTWQNGRQLAGISKDGLTASYAYNDSGIRLRKTVNGVTTQYYLNGSLILSEVTGDVQTDYYYDESGNVFGFKRGNSEYYYIRNGQGDIIGILDSSGTQIVSYVYDSWGKLVSVSGSQVETIGEANPFRYRGYYYDTETGLYYLQSRYYDPEVGRFINADGILGGNLDVLSYNLFAYCSNNPVNYCDPTGNNIFSDIWEGLTEFFTGFIADYDSVSLSRANRKKGKTPPSSWPPLPDNIGGKKPKWNPDGYWEGKEGNLTWDSHSHGAGVDRGNGPQDGHWDDEKSNRRWDREGNPLISPSAPKWEFNLPELPFNPPTGYTSPLHEIFSGVYNYVESFINDYQVKWDK